jgi:hypothetical protein
MVESIEKIIDHTLNKLEAIWGDGWQPMPENPNDITGSQNSGVYQVRNKISKKINLIW